MYSTKMVVCRKQEVFYLKATGIVRRIDDLGRVVIPKEIRRTLRIREGDPLEIYTDREGDVILKKYSPLGDISVVAQQYADSLAPVLGCTVCISDRDQIIAAAGTNKKEMLGKALPKEIENAINNRDNFIAKKGEEKYVKIASNLDGEFDYELLNVIICEGDAIGAVMLLGRGGKYFSEHENKIAQIAAAFLGKQMEG